MTSTSALRCRITWTPNSQWVAPCISFSASSCSFFFVFSRNSLINKILYLSAYAHVWHSNPCDTVTFREKKLYVIFIFTRKLFKESEHWVVSIQFRFHVKMPDKYSIAFVRYRMKKKRCLYYFSFLASHGNNIVETTDGFIAFSKVNCTIPSILCYTVYTTDTTDNRLGFYNTLTHT